MAFPHPQSRKDHYRNEDIPSWGGIVRKFFKRTINIAEYRNAKDEVNPAKNRALGGITDHLIPSIENLLHTLALEIERHCSADEIFQGRLIDLVAFVDVDGAPNIPVEAGVD
jgi:hypothetical protein